MPHGAVDSITKGRYEKSFINRMFLGVDWREDANHWTRLDGHAQRIDALAMNLPAVVTCLESYSRFLSTIGQQSLPDAFKIVAAYFERSELIRITSNFRGHFLPGIIGQSFCVFRATSA